MPEELSVEERLDRFQKAAQVAEELNNSMRELAGLVGWVEVHRILNRVQRHTGAE